MNINRHVNRHKQMNHPNYLCEIQFKFMRLPRKALRRGLFPGGRRIENALLL